MSKKRNTAGKATGARRREVVNKAGEKMEYYTWTDLQHYKLDAVTSDAKTTPVKGS